MAIKSQARMQQLHGNYADLDKSKMLPAEIAVPNDHNPIARTENGYKELLTKDNEEFFEQKLEEINKAVDTIDKLATDMPDMVASASESAESAKQSATSALQSKESAKISETNAETYASSASNSATNANNSAESALQSKESAKTSETNADAYAKMSKSYAVGDTNTRDGENTDNAKYYAEYAKNVKEQIDNKLKLTDFDVDDDGELIYTDNSSTLWSVDDNGNLNWEVK